jgi:antitoxin (DNA-binding transcriptional repressor) of toxin-antitoxin stability system
VTKSRHNKPIADLVPQAKVEKPAPKFGTGKGKVEIIDPNWDKAIKTQEDLEAFLKGRI